MSHEICYHVCEVCGRQYISKLSAEICETKHFQPNGLIKVRHEFFDERFPNTIDVQLTNHDDTIRIWGEYKLHRKPLIPGIDYYPLEVEKLEK
jgi:hypothetical protein